MKLPWLNAEQAANKMDQLGRSNEAFFFLISFDKEKNLVLSKSEWPQHEVYFTYPLEQNTLPHSANAVDIFQHQLPTLQRYRKAFQEVQAHLKRGDTYLLNLSFEVPIQLDGRLQDVFHLANAPYKVYLKDHFVSFSPESFIKIKQNKAYTFPMKGTISTAIPNASEVILDDEKEKAEHYTIVDLLRNDLSSIGHETSVNRFRYLSPIHSRKGTLLQVSSEIECTLEKDWNHDIGNLLFRLLPAGSISGAPKKKTVEIINNVESHARDWYTGIAGVYRNYELNSSVLIRYIAQKGNQHYYKTGGGITFMSELEKEYEEIRSKIYIPIN